MSKTKLYSPHYFAMKPTGMTLFFRTFVPWQVLRFLAVNLQMTKMILKSHDTRVQNPRRQQPRPLAAPKAQAAPAVKAA